MSRDAMIGGLKPPYEPQPASDLDLVFPASVPDRMVSWADIPEEFHRGNTKWNRLMNRWFYEGLPVGTDFRSKPGVDCDLALRHLKMILGSYEPKHEHKEACVAYLMSLWFDDVILPGEKREPAPMVATSVPVRQVERREDMRQPADYLYTIEVARKRFTEELAAGTAQGVTFKEWARRTYAPRACTGKLRKVVEGTV